MEFKYHVYRKEYHQPNFLGQNYKIVKIIEFIHHFQFHKGDYITIKDYSHHIKKVEVGPKIIKIYI